MSVDSAQIRLYIHSFRGQFTQIDGDSDIDLVAGVDIGQIAGDDRLINPQLAVVDIGHKLLFLADEKLGQRVLI